MPAAISVRDLWVRYRARNGKNVDAVQGLSFDVDEAEVVGFLGPNGAGKSSTIKALMGFVLPQSGECSVKGLPAGSLKAKGFIGYLPEVALYYPYLTPLETLRLYGELQGLRGKPLRTQASDLLTVLGLEKALGKQNRTLSKGMLQRVGIAQALLGDPQVLILDEVTSGLDPIGRSELRAILKARQAQGCTLFFSSHELSEVEGLCDRILVIDAGRLIDERALDGLKDELRRFTVTFEGSCDLADLGSERPLKRKDGVWEVSFSTKPALLEALARLGAAGARIVDFSATDGSLEEYFVETVRRAA